MFYFPISSHLLPPSSPLHSTLSPSSPFSCSPIPLTSLTLPSPVLSLSLSLSFPSSFIYVSNMLHYEINAYTRNPDNSLELVQVSKLMEGQETKSLTSRLTQKLEQGLVF